MLSLVRHAVRSGSLVLVLAAFGLAAGASAAGAREHSDPVLMLPGSHGVRPGQWIDLRWTDADDVRELEILLSDDGGRSYRVCVSPQLSPHDRRFRWQVPPTAKGSLHLRIRFNRNGSEIEGPPSSPVHVLAECGQEDGAPWALPATELPGGPTDSRSNPRGQQAPSGVSPEDAADADRVPASQQHPASHESALRVATSRLLLRPPSSPDGRPPRSLARSLPLRT